MGRLRTIYAGDGFAFMPANYMRIGLNQKKIISLGKSSGLWTHQIRLYSRKELAQGLITEKLKFALEKETMIFKKN